MNRGYVRADKLLVLDIDGTLLDTPHLSAWRVGLARVLREHDSTPRREITVEQYHRHVAGHPREVGARAVLEIAGVAPSEPLIGELARVKQELFLERAAQETVLFADARRFLECAAHRGASLSFCTASRNAGELLAKRFTHLAAGDWLLDRLAHSLGQRGHYGDLSRTVALEHVAAAWRTSVSDCVLVDDSWSGVIAGRQVGMNSILLDRAGLRPASADQMAIATLDELHIVNGGNPT